MRAAESPVFKIDPNALSNAVVKEVLSIQGTTAQDDAAELTKRVSEWLEKIK